MEFFGHQYSSLLDLVMHLLIVAVTWFLAVTTTWRGFVTLYLLHKNESMWNCGNLSHEEASVWTQGITTIAILFMASHIETVFALFTDHEHIHHIFFWSWHSVHIGTLLLAKRVLAYLERSANGECVFSHKNGDDTPETESEE